MKFTSLPSLLIFGTCCSLVGAAEPAPKEEAAPQRHSTNYPRRPATPPATPVAPAKPVDPNAVIVSDGSTVVKSEVPITPAPAEKPKDPAAEAAAAAEAERVKAADEASAFARGEGERYARRQKAYEEARSGANRAPAVPTKTNSIAQAQLPDGRNVVIVGGDRKVFANKAQADAYVAEIKRADANRPFVIGSGK
jgi:hypothetical protein